MNTKNYRSRGKATVLLNLLSDPAAIVDEKGNFLTVNDAFEEVTGLSRKELIGNPFVKLNILTPESKTVLLENLKKRIQGAHVDPYEVYFADKLGEKRCVEVKGKMVSYAGYTANLVVFHDVTLRKENARRLKEYSERMEALVEEKVKEIQDREEKYRKLFDESLDAVFVADVETGIIVDCNPAASKLVGRQKSELVGQHQSIITPQEQMDGEFARVFKQHLKDQTRTLETQIMRKTGEIRDVAVRDTIFELNGRKLMQRTIRDITDLKKAEQAIKETEDRYHELIDALPEIVFETDLTGKLTFFNQTAFKITGYTQEEFQKGMYMLQFVVPDQRERVVENTKKSLNGGGGDPHEYTLIRRNGTTYPVLVKTAPIVSGNRVTGLRGFVLDITERKKAEQILRDSEEKFRNLAEHSPNMIFICQKGKVVYANTEAEKAVGYSKEEFYSSEFSFLDLVTPENREFVQSNFAKHTKSEDTAPYEYGLMTKDGRKIDAILNTKIITYNGEPAILGIVTDITERKQMNLKLADAEQRYHVLFDEAPLGVLVIDPQTAKPVEFNDVAHTQLGYSREEFSKLHISDFEAKEKAEETNAHLAKMVREGGDEFETKHRTKNGEIRNVLVNTKVVELAGKPFLYCVFRDITEIRKAQDALMESESQYRQLVNAAQEGIWAMDSNYRTVFVNPRMAEMLGYAESEMVEKSIFEFLDNKHIEQASHFLGQFKQGFKGHFDYMFARKDGSRIYVSIAASVISDDEGKPLGTLAMVSDITDRKVLETKVNNYSKHLKSMVELRTAQLKNANEQLVKSERLAAIGELAGMVGHDLRNPLTGIKNAAYYLKKKGTTISEAQVKEMLEIIDKSIDYSNKIINDLLDYSREIHLELTEYALPMLLDNAIRMIQVPDRIQIVNHVLGETWASVDSDKMMRVFINLIKNAVDAMPEKGTLEITSRQTRDNLEISFADTGTGIPEETLPKIFTPLFTTKAQGMGFGLAICKRIIEAHGGTITVKTAVNQGTTFTVTLPIKPKVEVGGEKTWINMPESLLSTTTKT